MKRAVAVALPALAGLAMIAAAWTGPAPARQPETVSGTVVDVACRFTTGQSGPTHVACAEMCAKAGVPLGILTADGRLYIPMKHGEGPNTQLLAYAEQDVVATGRVFPAAGAFIIEIETIARKS
jgi:hypothetical protein